MIGTKHINLWMLIALVVVVSLIVPWAARADTVQNDVAKGGVDPIAVGESLTVDYWIKATNNDGVRGCNASDLTPAIVTIVAPASVTAVPSSLIFTECDEAGSVTFTASEAGSYGITVSVYDAGGGGYNTSPAAFTLTVLPPDTTPPWFGDCPAAGPFYVDSGDQVVGPIEAWDDTELDLAASTLTGVVNTGSVGFKDLTFTAVDTAGNIATKTCTYQVIYYWTGFFSPVDNLPILNQVKAGSAVPVKFSLSGDWGLGILTGDPTLSFIACDAGAPPDGVGDTVAAGASSLEYDPVEDQYIYVWKTEKGWAGMCGELVVQLNDGTDHRANFQFK